MEDFEIAYAHFRQGIEHLQRALATMGLTERDSKMLDKSLVLLITGTKMFKKVIKPMGVNTAEIRQMSKLS